MQLMFDWADLRFFLAVARSGTTLRAARELGTSQPTVVRRIGALERACGVTLFARGPAGYVLSEVGRDLLPLAERCEAQMQAFEDALTARRTRDAAKVRLTVPTGLDSLLMPPLQAFQRQWPSVQLQIVASNRRHDLARGEADVAMRAGHIEEDEELLVRQLPPGGWGVYAGRCYAAERSLPSNATELAHHPLIGGEGSVALLPAFHWLDANAPEQSIVWRSNSLPSLQSAIRAGIGVSILPCAVAGNDPELVLCFGPIAELTVPLWLVTRRELRRLSYVRALMDSVSAHLHANAVLLTGPATQQHSGTDTR